MGHRDLLLVAIISTCLLSACTHTMQVKNLRDYSLEPTHSTRRDVAVVRYTGSGEGRIFFQHIVQALRAHPSVAQLRTDWRWDTYEPGFEPDIVLRITPRVDYRGSFWNLPITFPGFLIFTHAWSGYVYTGDAVTQIEIYDPASRRVVESSEIPTRYRMRHTAFDRAFWAVSGWWMPGYGATALLSGLVFIGYDDEATDPFHQEIERPYGEYLAEKVMRPAIEYARERDRTSAALTSAVGADASP
jgi:hypothetical protein